MAKASNKKKIKKAPVNKAKKAVTKVKKAASKKSSPVRKKVTKPSVKKAVKKTAKKVVKKTALKKAVSKKKSVKVVSKKSAPKKPVKVKSANKTSPATAKKLKQDVKAGKTSKASSKDLKPKKDRNAFDEKMEQKAQRIMKELEERMDISKVKPRISVSTSAPKPKPAPVVIKLPEPTNTTKEKFQMEFELRSSKSILFYYLSDSSGLAGWFADDVYEKEGRFTFTWEGSEQSAKLVASRENSLIRFEWETETDGTYFQFEIKEDEITGDIALIITDWANPGEQDSNNKLWESQVLKLRQLIGS